MSHVNFHQRATSPARRGMATLEFAMALPFLLLLMVAITWLGFSVITQTEVLVEARNKAWQKRFDDMAKQPLMFPANVVVAKNPLYSYEKDYVTETVTRAVDVSPLFKAMPAPKATHTVLAGSWDHRAMKMDKPPNLELYGRAVLNAATGEIQTKLGNIANIFEGIKENGAAAIAQAITQGSDVTSKGKETESTGGAEEAATKAKEKQDKEALERKLAKLGGIINPLNDTVMPVDGGELDRTIDEITSLEIELLGKRNATPLKDQEEEKKRLAELDRIDRRIDLLKDKRQRMESEIRDITQELKAFDD